MIVAIVGEDIITRNELSARKKLAVVEINQARRDLPNDEVLSRQVLNLMIDNSVLGQEARKRGIVITDSQLDQAMQQLAQNNGLSLTKFREAIITQGIPYPSYRESLRHDLAINRLRRQYTNQTVSLSDSEIDEFIARSGNDSINYDYSLSHILIAVPDGATPAQVKTAQQTTDEILLKLQQGQAFEMLANQYSNSSNALQGGDLGWRKKAEIPGLFTDTVLNMKPGDYDGPLRSASGFHIVHLKEKRNAETILTQQIKSRHILVQPNEIITEEAAQEQLRSLRAQIIAGAAFAKLAEIYSVDYGSAVAGGDIGWSSKGDTVPEYNSVMERLEPNDISEPFRSQFGWHILEVTGHRTVDQTDESQRENIRRQLLGQKMQDAFEIWQRRLRDEAYILYPEA
ncbi:MAG: molecular chaperone SurA [Gammaproteobacteria bacterium]|nr:molecular chaperone SurA [Gammaproteobacteria bacterium]